MKYLRAIISSETRGEIYKKDFKVEAVFGLFARTVIDSMIKVGVIGAGYFYRILVIPRTGTFQDIAMTVSPSASLSIGTKSEWIALEFEEPIEPGQELSFFSLEIYVVSQLLRYRSNFQMDTLEYFWRRINRALEMSGGLRYQETLTYQLFALDDELYDFEKESVQIASRDISPLVEFVETEEKPAAQLVFPQKFLSEFPIRTTMRFDRGKTVEVSPEEKAPATRQPDTVQILLAEEILRSIQELARMNVNYEQGGTLVGNVYENAESNERQYIIEITGHIPAEETFANEVELRYTFASWQKRTSLLKEQFPNQRIVGWYHTHLDIVGRSYFTDETRQEVYTTPLFFSQQDRFTHRQFFREPWYVAMVLDQRGNLVFFFWKDQKIKPGDRFFVLESTREEPKQIKDDEVREEAERLSPRDTSELQQDGSL